MRLGDPLDIDTQFNIGKRKRGKAVAMAQIESRVKPRTCKVRFPVGASVEGQTGWRNTEAICQQAAHTGPCGYPAPAQMRKLESVCARELIRRQPGLQHLGRVWRLVKRPDDDLHDKRVRSTDRSG